VSLSFLRYFLAVKSKTVFFHALSAVDTGARQALSSCENLKGVQPPFNTLLPL